MTRGSELKPLMMMMMMMIMIVMMIMMMIMMMLLLLMMMMMVPIIELSFETGNGYIDVVVIVTVIDKQID